jgi:hypothetical protein
MDEKQLISRLGYMAADLAGTIEGDAADAAIQRLADLTAKLAAAEARAERAERERDALIEAWPELDDGEEGASRRVWAANGLWWAETADGLVPESSRDAAVRVAAGLAPADEPAGPAKGGRDGE